MDQKLSRVDLNNSVDRIIQQINDQEILMNVVYLLILKILLPLSLLTSAVIRYNGFSGFYLVFCLLLLAFDHDKKSMFLIGMVIILLVVSITFTLCHPIVHILIIFYPNFLKNCSSPYVLYMYQIGITNLLQTKFYQVVRLVAPDIIIMIVSIICLIYISRFNNYNKFRQRKLKNTFIDGVFKSNSIHTLLWSSWLYQRIKVLVNIFLTGFAGIISPSFLNLTYLLLFLIGGSMWSSGVPITSTNLYFCRIFVLTYVGMHIVLIYAVQIEYFQTVFPNGALYSRLLGLYYKIDTSCERHGSVTILQQRFFDFMNPFALFALFYIHSLDSKIWLDREAIQNLALFTKSSSSQNTNAAVSQKKNRFTEHIHNTETTATGMPAISLPFIWSVITSLVKNSYIFSFIAMMAWSVTYKSWLTFVLLILACILWLLPDSRAACLVMSPFIVGYGIMLIFINYVTNINGDEIMNTIKIFFEPYFEISEFGIFEWKIPFIPLLLTIGYLVVFWLTLRLYMKEKIRLSVSSQIDRARSSVIFEDNSTFKSLVYFLHKLCAKYWIFGCTICLLLVSIQKQVKIIYLVYMMFLVILMTFFMFSYSFWRRQMYIYWWLVIVYSLGVLFGIYTFQFKIFQELWFNYTIFTQENLKDFGFEVFDMSSLLEGLLSPVILLIVTIIQVHYFHNPFMKMSDLTPKRLHHEMKVISRESSTSRNQNNYLISIIAKLLSKLLHKKEDSYAKELNYLVYDANGAIYILTRKLIIIFKYIYYKIWRILEIHFTKIIIIAISKYATSHVSAYNGIYMILIVLFFPFDSLHDFLVSAIFFLLSMQMIANMMFQLIILENFEFKTNCSLKNKYFAKFTLDQMDNLEYIGLLKYSDFQPFAWSIAFNMILCSLWHVIKYHQIRYYNFNTSHKPEHKLVFPYFTFRSIDHRLTSAVKGFLNFAFYKMGLEICFIVTVINAYIRLDVFSVFYLIVTFIFLPSSRTFCSKLWIVYLFVLGLLILCQYAICVGFPPLLCKVYPFHFPYLLEDWLFLPSYLNPPEASKLIGDVIQYMCVNLQYYVFKIENNIYKYKGGENRPIVFNELPKTEDKDFISNKNSYMDYLKQIIFCWFYWLTLGIVFFNGIMRNTLFCLGYMILATVYFWVGQQFILSRRKYLLSSWNIILFYNFIIILIKCNLQLVSCVYIDHIINYSKCWLIHILGIHCIPTRENHISISIENSCGHINNDFYWDVLCFIFLVIQRKIFTTKSFGYVVLDMKITNKFTSRGALLINKKLMGILTEEKEKENQIFTKIKEKILRIEQTHQNYGRPLPNEHYLVLRSGDYFLFEEHQEEYEYDDRIDDSFEFLKGFHGKSDEQIKHKSNEMLDYMLVNSIDDIKFKRNCSTQHFQFANNLLKNSVIPMPIARSHTEKSSYKVNKNKSNKIFFKKDYVVLNSEEHSSSESSISASPVNNSEDTIEKDSSEEDRSKYWKKEDSKIWKYYTFFLTCLDKLIIKINLLTKDIRYVRNILENEKRLIKTRIITYTEGDWMGSYENSFFLYKNQGQTLEINIKLNAFLTQTEDHFQILYRVVELENIDVKLYYDKINKIDNEPHINNTNNVIFVDETSQAQQFQKSSSRLFLLIVAIGNLVIIYSDMLCYMILVMNHMISVNMLSLLYPLSVFLWAMLSTPRPSTFYWIFIILYTQLVILIKYVFQFKFIDIESDVNALEKDSPFFLPVFLGINKTEHYALIDLLQLFVLFLHRGYLKNHGLWKGFKDKFNIKEPEKKTNFNTLQTSSLTSRFILLKPFITVKKFYMNLASYRYSKRVDVYVYMFICEFISFFIIVIGYEAFGPGTGSTSTALDFLKDSKIPIPFILMLITQFIFIIIDRALFLRKHVIGKLVFQIFYVILIHVWIFFLNPFISRSKYNARMAPQFLYFFKCVYFALSSYQIKSGYPLRILGNFLTKKYNYLNLFLFKGYLLVPFLYELRNVMDWIWTDTALSLYHWMEVEDVFAKIFVLKCWRRSELEYPTPRGTNRWHVTKYLVGGLLMIFFFLCFWGPLVLGSVIGSIFVRNPPFHCKLTLEFDGFSKIYEYNSRGDMLQAMSDDEYNYIKDCYKNNVVALSFMKSFEPDDVTIMYISNVSESIWSITPPNKDLFMKSLLDKKITMNLNSMIECERNPSDTKTTKTVVDYTFVKNLSLTERTEIASLFTIPKKYAVLVKGLPRFLVATKTDFQDALVLGSENSLNPLESYMIMLSIERSTSDWWQLHSHKEFDCLSRNPFSPDKTKFFIFSERISDNLFGQLFSRYGIIGIYAAYIFVAHRLLRAVYSNISYIIRCEELPYVDRILKLLNEIYLVRENKMFRLEEQLVAKLIFVYRSDETMIRFTRLKQSILDEHMDK